MLVEETYKNMQIPDDYDLYVSEVKQIENICQKESLDGKIYAFDLISLAFKVGFSFGQQYEIDKKIWKEHFKSAFLFRPRQKIGF